MGASSYRDRPGVEPAVRQVVHQGWSMWSRALLARKDDAKASGDAMENRELTDDVRRSVPGDYLDLSDGKTRYEISGPAAGPPVVFIAGATLPYMVWDPVFLPLAELGYRVLRFDLYGRGYSDRPRVRYDVALFRRQILDLTEALGLRAPLNLVALAFGAPISILLTEKAPKQVESLCLIAPDGLGVKLSLAARLAYLPGVGEALMTAFGKRVLLGRLPDYSDDEDLNALLLEHFEPTLSINGFRRGLLSSLRNIPVHRAAGSYAAVGELGIPSCVVWGENDVVTPFKGFDLMKSLLPQAEFHSMPNVGHLPQFERPEETLDIISRFLERATGDPKRSTRAS